jgi:MYXO-CTERM domain-containing protein
MNFDLRLPLGLIFTTFGAILVIYGLASGPRSLGINVDRDWGAVVLVFGLCMLGLAFRARRRRSGG